jgi:lipoprotein-releasing system permease protein
MRFELFLARRFLTGQRFGVFRAITTGVAITGTALGVAALIITLAVMDGFRTDIQEKILGTQPHVVAQSPFGGSLPFLPMLSVQLSTAPHVLAAAPYISAQALIQTDSRVTGILLRGVDPALEPKVTRSGHILLAGKWDDLTDSSVFLGKELADAVRARVGEEITLVAPEQDSKSIYQTPRMRRFRVAGIFRSGMYEYDANMAYTSIKAAQNLLGTKGEVTGYGLRLDDVDAAPEVGAALQQQLGMQYWVRTWQDFNRPLFSAMKLERTVMFLIVTLVILVSSFTIISNLLLLTIEKAREIGVLQALGASPSQVGRIFLFNGLMLGGGGVTLGLVLGIGVSLLLERYPIIRLPADVYYVDRLPIRLDATMIYSVALCAFILVLVSILYPARKAQELDPVQAIRYG